MIDAVLSNFVLICTIDVISLTCCYAVPFDIILSYFTQHCVIWSYGQPFFTALGQFSCITESFITLKNSPYSVWMLDYKWRPQKGELFTLWLDCLTNSCSTSILIASLFVFWLNRFILHFSIPVKKIEQFVLMTVPLFYCLCYFLTGTSTYHLFFVCIIWNSCIFVGNGSHCFAV